MLRIGAPIPAGDRTAMRNAEWGVRNDMPQAALRLPQGEDGAATSTGWLAHGTLVTPLGVREGVVGITEGRIVAIRSRAPRGARVVNVRGGFVAPGFIDLHAWGEPRALARELIRHGTTAFLTTLGPEAPRRMAETVRAHAASAAALEPGGAECLGLHLEGPFLNPARAGALPARWMREPSLRELERLQGAAQGRVRIVTLAPELPGARAMIRWCEQHRVVASLGHSEADAAEAARGAEAGARAVTHVFNGMRPFHHRNPGLVGMALTDERVTAMVIADGVHASPAALALLMRAKGPGGIALVSDAVRHQRQAWRLHACAGAYRTPAGTLAGSRLTMITAVRNMVALAGASLGEAVRMAADTPVRLLGLRDRGTLEVGRRADLVVFDERFRVMSTWVAGRCVYQQGDR